MSKTILSPDEATYYKFLLAVRRENDYTTIRHITTSLPEIRSCNNIPMLLRAYKEGYIHYRGLVKSVDRDTYFVFASNKDLVIPGELI